jgi:hypothetical protein
MLYGNVGSETPSHVRRHFGKTFHNGKCPIDDGDQTGAEQLRQMSGQPHLLSLPRRTHQAKQLGDRAGPESGHPEPSDIGVGWLDPVVAGDEPHRDGGADLCGRANQSTCGPHGAVDRRTILATRRCSGSHVVNNYKYY